MAETEYEGEFFCTPGTNDRAAWTAAYVIIGAILVLVGIAHFWISRGDLFGPRSQEEHGQFSAQVTFLCGIFARGIGHIVSGIIVAKRWNWAHYSLLASGLPGYITAIGYCFIFFSWCSVVVDFVAKKSTGFYKKSKITLLALAIGVTVGFIISFGCMYSDSEPAHAAEGAIATLRDFVIAGAFAIYMFKVWKLFENPCGQCGTPEMNILIMCGILIAALIFRGISIIAYIYIISKVAETNPGYECSMSYLGIFILEMILCEIMPLCSIFANRLRIAFMDKSDLGTQREDVSFVSFV